MTTIRRGLEEDLPAIQAIQAASPEASQWNARDYLGYDLWVAESGGAITGFLVAQPLTPGEGELLNLAVAPDWRRRGVAKALIQTFFGEFPAVAHLEVRAGNLAARNLYKSMGFKEVNLRPKYYDSPEESAIVMKFHSC